MLLFVLPLRRIAVAAAAILGVLAVALALAASPTVPLWSTVDGGGTRSSSGGLSITGTIGQPDAGTSTRLGWVLRGGYWGGGATATAVEPPGDLPAALVFRLHPVHPNPFNPATRVSFDLPAPARARVRIYNLRGGLVTTLIDRELPAGPHSVVWRGTDHRGSAVASGVYFLALDAGADHARQKIALVR